MIHHWFQTLVARRGQSTRAFGASVERFCKSIDRRLQSTQRSTLWLCGLRIRATLDRIIAADVLRSGRSTIISKI